MEFNYNCLDLLSLAKRDNQTFTQYTYDANGTKLSVRNGDGSSGYDYLGSLIYKKTTGGVELESAMFVDGSLKPTETNYFLCDHLGSVRSVVNRSGTVQEQNDFYPFGSEYADTSYANSNNRFLFSGKERQDLLDEGIYDFGARMYDAALGKWHVVDPLFEKYYPLSPYLYCGNNPLVRIDINGCDWNEAKNHLYNSVSAKFSFGLQIRAKVNNIGVDINAQNIEFTEKGIQYTKGIGLDLYAVSFEKYDSVYDIDKFSSAREERTSMSFFSYGKDIRTTEIYDKSGKYFEKIGSTTEEEIIVGSAINLSFAALIGVDISFDYNELYNFIIDLFK